MLLGFPAEYLAVIQTLVTKPGYALGNTFVCDMDIKEPLIGKMISIGHVAILAATRQFIQADIHFPFVNPYLGIANGKTTFDCFNNKRVH